MTRLAEGLAKPRAQKTLAAIQQRARLMIAERRCHAFATVRFRPFDAFHRVVRDGVLLAQIFEQQGQRRQPMPDRRFYQECLQALSSAH